MASCAEKTSSKASRSRAFGHSARSAADCGRCRMCSACQKDGQLSDSTSEASSHSGKSGTFVRASPYDAVQKFLREAQRQGIDRLYRRELRPLGRSQDIIGMGHLKARAVALHATRHNSHLIQRQETADCVPVAVEEYDVERRALVLANDAQRCTRRAFRGGVVTNGRHHERRYGSRGGLADGRRQPAVEIAVREMPKKIDDPRRADEVWREPWSAALRLAGQDLSGCSSGRKAR